MSTSISNQPWPKEPWRFEVIGTQRRLFDATGADITNDFAAQARMIECVNGMTGIWLAETHVQEVFRRLNDLEKLRKHAWDRVEEMEAEAAA